MVKKAVEKGLTQKNYYLGIKPLVVNFVENMHINYQCRKTYQNSSFRNTALSYDFVEKHLYYSIRKTYHSSSFRNKEDTKCSEYLAICEYFEVGHLGWQMIKCKSI